MFKRYNITLCKTMVLLGLFIGPLVQAQDHRTYTATEIDAVLGTSTSFDFPTTGDDLPDGIVDASGYVRLSLTSPDADWYSYALRLSVVSASAPGVFDGNPTEITLTVSNNTQQGAGNSSVDVAQWRLPGSYGASITILEGTYDDLGSNGPPNTNGPAPSNVVLQIGYAGLAYSSLTTTAIMPYPPVSQDNEVNLSWPMVTGAEFYQLEWTFIDGYPQDPTQVFLTSDNVPLTLRDFELNNTRIQTENLQYTLPLIYPRGYLVYRVRAVGRDITDPTRYRYGEWSRGDGNELWVADWEAGDHVVVISQALEHQSNKNWQFQASYAEEGKKKEVVSYFDGTLRNRQTVTKINTDDNVIVGEVVYDAQGRPAVEILPVPASGVPSLDFVNNFNQNSTGSDYRYQDFDLDTQNILDQFDAGKAMANTSGASNYYSTSNGLTTPFRNRVPNAAGFPFSQIEYTPDNTGRIKRKSGVGVTHQLGSGHEMEYYYGVPDQKELNRLFGYSVGNFSHYKKNLVIDPNDQASVSYIDPQGRTIATALVGYNPDNLTGLADEADASGLHAQITADLLGKVAQTDFDTSFDNNVREATGNFGAFDDVLVYSGSKMSAFSEPRLISYNRTASPFNYSCDGGTEVFNISYNLLFDVTDAGGNSLVTNQDNTGGGINLTATVPRGSFNVTKRLTVDPVMLEQEADRYIEMLMDPNTGSCYLPEDAAYAPSLPDNLIDNCAVTQTECIAALEEAYTDAGTYAAIRLAAYDFSNTPEDKIAEERARLDAFYQEQWYDLLAACGANGNDGTALPDTSDETSLEQSISCTIIRSDLLEDLRPSGQYGARFTQIDGDTSQEVGQPQLMNIFDEGNILVSTAVEGITEHNSWRNPRHPEYDTTIPQGGSLYQDGHYYNEDGTISYIEVVVEENEEGLVTYAPEVVQEALTGIDPEATKFYIEPQDLHNSSDFISDGIWQDSWAGSLLTYHPEYCYLVFEEASCTLTSSAPGALMNSDGYDEYLGTITNYAEASSAGLLSANIWSRDPFFAANTPTGGPLSGIQFGLRNTLIQEAVETNYGGTGLSMYQNTYSAMFCNTYTTCDPTNPNLNGFSTEELDEFWTRYKANYFNVKQMIRSLFANIYAKRNGCYNGCIGEPEVPADILAVIGDYTSINKNLLNDLIKNFPNPYCEDLLVAEYATKQKRFIPSDVMYDAGQSDEAILEEFQEYTDYGYYTTTGVCPLARDFQLFLEYLLRDLAQSGLPANYAFTGRYINNDLINEFGADPFNGLALSASYSGATLSVSLDSGITPFTVTLPAYASGWSSFGTGGWTVARIAGIKSFYDAANTQFGYSAVAYIIDNVGNTTEAVISGTTQARIAECTVTPDPNSVGPYLGNGDVSGSQGGYCEKEDRFTSAYVGLLNGMNDANLLGNPSLVISGFSAYNNSYLPTFFESNTATWVAAGSSYAIQIGGYDNFILTLDSGTLPTGSGITYTGLSISTTTSTEGLITNQLASLTYLDVNRNSQTITGTLTGIDGALVNFLCCDEDINTIADEVVNEPEFVTCEQGALSLKSEATFQLRELMNALIGREDFFSRGETNLADYPEYNLFLQRFLQANAVTFCRDTFRDCPTANVDYLNATNVFWHHDRFSYGNSPMAFVYRDDSGNEIHRFRIDTLLDPIPSQVESIIDLTYLYEDPRGDDNFNIVFFANGFSQSLGLSITQSRTNATVSGGSAWFGAYWDCSLLQDTDNDGLLDFEDNCPNNYNPNQEDRDGDGKGDVCDDEVYCGSLPQVSDGPGIYVVNLNVPRDAEGEVGVYFNAASIPDYLQIEYNGNVRFGKVIGRWLNNPDPVNVDEVYHSYDNIVNYWINEVSNDLLPLYIYENGAFVDTGDEAVAPTFDSGDFYNDGAIESDGRMYYTFNKDDNFSDLVTITIVGDPKGTGWSISDFTCPGDSPGPLARSGFKSDNLGSIEISNEEISNIAKEELAFSRNRERSRGLITGMDQEINTLGARVGLAESVETCTEVPCIPPVPEPKSCTEEYPQYVALMTALTDRIAVENDIVPEDEFCSHAFQHLVDDYAYYLSNFGVTSVLSPFYLDIGTFGATEFNYGYPGMSTSYNGRTPVIDAYFNHVSSTPQNDRMNWAAYTSFYLDQPNNVDICIPQAFDVTIANYTIEIPDTTPCQQFKESMITAYTNSFYAELLAEKRQEFVNAYLRHALDTPVETLNMTYYDKEYQYTLYYYDQAGNLVQTVPPEGVDRFPENELNSGLNDNINQYRDQNETLEGPSLLPDHRLVTEYRYNSLNQLVWQQTPDGGITRFAYDKLGRIVASQNAKQLANNRFSYTQYDALGRIIEAGELIPNIAVAIDDTTGKLIYSSDGSYVDSTYDPVSPKTAYPFNVSGGQNEVTYTFYSNPPDYALELFDTATDFEEVKINSRNRVSRVYYYDSRDAVTGQEAYDNALFYHYDIHGNVQELAQQHKGMVLDAANPNSGIKKLRYEYDLISGNVNKVVFQDGQADMFAHRYFYDADNRINKAETSGDGLVWEQDATYQYFAHGPLARTVLGGREVQGMDYAYTLQGWLKAVNSESVVPTADMGADGGTGSTVATDAMGYSLQYYVQDYLPIGNINDPFTVSNANYAADTFEDIKVGYSLYNGNIRMMAVGLRNTDETLLTPQVNKYGYDQLNRIKAYKGINVTGPLAVDSYSALYEYDRNGNLESLVRRVFDPRKGSELMDQLVYDYTRDTQGNKIDNQLNKVDDDTRGNSKYGDLAGNQVNENYGYDAIGQLIEDQEEGLNIDWRVDGKVRSVTKSDGTVITFEYDGLGNRIAKNVDGANTHYIRDAQGNPLAVYESVDNGTVASDMKLTEHHIYGSSRLGMEQKTVALNEQPVTTVAFNNTVGDKRYELSNHLGNVMSVVTDRKVVDTGGSLLPDVIAYNDYYPFGMLLPGRIGNSMDYRYGFQGQEMDNEIKGEGNSLNYTFRMYDPRVGRFFAVDPLQSKFPYYTPYQFAGNKVILFTELEGLEEKIPEIQNTIYAKSFYNPKLDMDMSDVGKNATTINGNKTIATTFTVKDGARNYVAYWNKQLEANPEMFDAANKAKIKNGAAPTVNDQWIRHNPTHAEFKDDKLVHHHKYQGKVATAIPKTAHDKYSKNLHPFRRVKTGLTKRLTGIKGKLGKIGTVLSVATTIIDFLSDDPNSTWNQSFGNGLNVGQLYSQLDENYIPITGAYYIINYREFNYDKNGKLESVTGGVTEYYLLENKDNEELELREGRTTIQTQNRKQSRAVIQQEMH